MHKRTPRLHLQFDTDLSSPREAKAEPDHLNAHMPERDHRPDIRQDRKRTRQHLHLLEGSYFDEEWAADLDAAA